MNANASRIKTIIVRHSTPSREGISITVAQIQDDMGRWMVPTITTSGPIQQIIESGRFARDVGIALLVASWIHDQWMIELIEHGSNSLE